MAKKVGTCPVLTERVGKATKHNMVSVIPWCKRCKPKGLAHVSGPGDLCGRKHNGGRYCNGCRKYTDDWQECQWYVAIAMGMSTHFGFCSNKAKELHHMDPRHHLGGKVWRWVCGMHTPDAFARRKAKQEAKYQAWEDGFNRRLRRDKDEGEYEEILVEMAGWMAKNPDLVAEDEWLGKITTMMADNETLLEKITNG